MIRGPKEYVPPVEVEVLMKRVAIPLDENEGIYVRDIKTGKVCNKFVNSETIFLFLKLDSEIVCSNGWRNVSFYDIQRAYVLLITGTRYNWGDLHAES